MTPKRRNRTMLRLEQLETRLAPALWVSPYRVDYIDADNDRISIVASKAIFPTVEAANLILAWNNGQAVEPDTDIENDFGAILTTVNLNAADDGLTSGMNLTIKLVSRIGQPQSQPDKKGNGLAGIPADATGAAPPGVVILADQISLGDVSVKGDLSQIIAGNGAVAVKSLTVESIGQFNPSVVDSTLSGSVGLLKVVKNVTEATVAVDGVLTTLQIGGSLVGTDNAGSAVITATGDIADVTVSGSLLGGTDNSGRIESNSKIAKVFIGGNVKGGSGANSGVIQSDGQMGPVRVVGSLVGSTNTSGVASGIIRSVTDNILGVSIGRDIVGGAADNSGQILSPADILVVRVGGNLLGGTGIGSGRIHADGNLGDISIFGSVKGDVLNTSANGNSNNAEISAFGNIGNVRINGDLVGGAGQVSGIVFSGGSITAVSIGKSILSGADDFSGGIFSQGNMGSIRITGNIDGTRAVASVTGERHIGPYSAAVIAGVVIDPTLDANLNVIKGATDSTIVASINSVNIGGSIKAGINNTTTKVDGPNALVFATGDITNLRIGKNLEGGVNVDSLSPSGYIQAKRLPLVFIGGDVKAPNNSGTSQENSAAIRAVFDIGDIIVKGSLLGNANNKVSITAFGEEDFAGSDTAFGDGDVNTDRAIKSISVFKNVTNTNIMAGYQADAVFTGQFGFEINTTGLSDQASIGFFQNGVAKGGIFVGGSFTASNVVAGASEGPNGFGDTGVAMISGGSRVAADSLGLNASFQLATISFIKINGLLVGSTGQETYGFVAADWSTNNNFISFKFGTKIRSTDPTASQVDISTLLPAAPNDGSITNLGPANVFLVCP